MIGKKKILIDILTNIVAVAIPTVVLQLYILPKISSYMTSEEYGLVVTILALMNTFPSAIGNVLNNVRLLHQLDYDEMHYPGDVPLILLVVVIRLIVICSPYLQAAYLEYTAL